MNKPIPAILIDSDGVCHTILNEDVDLFELGRVENVRRASHILFDEAAQAFAVIHARTGATLHVDPVRSAAIAWEIEHLGCSGEFYHAS